MSDQSQKVETPTTKAVEKLAGWLNGHPLATLGTALLGLIGGTVAVTIFLTGAGRDSAILEKERELLQAQGVLNATESENRELRRQAADRPPAVAPAPDVGASSAIDTLLKSKNPADRDLAVRLIGANKQVESFYVPVLAARLLDENPVVRANAALALAGMTDRSLSKGELLADRLAVETDAKVRAAILSGLSGGFPDHRDTAVFEKAATLMVDNREGVAVRGRAAILLIEIDRERGRTLVGKLLDRGGSLDGKAVAVVAFTATSLVDLDDVKSRCAAVFPELERQLISLATTSDDGAIRGHELWTYDESVWAPAHEALRRFGTHATARALDAVAEHQDIPTSRRIRGLAAEIRRRIAQDEAAQANAK